MLDYAVTGDGMKVSPEEAKIIQRTLAFWAEGYEIWAFGSRVHGRNLKPASDFDLVIKDDDALSDVDFQRIQDAFMISALPYRVDLLRWSKISEPFREIILREYEILQSASR